MKLKKIAFLVAKAGMSDAEFRAYWRGIHGPVVAGSPGYGAWRLRYAQNHVLGRGPVGEPFGFAGMAEFWLPGTSPNEDVYAQTSIYQDRVRVDELNFIDMDRTVSMSAHERIVRPGRGPVKVVVLSARAPGLSCEAFADGYGTAYADPVLADPALSRRITGWEADLVIPGSYRLPGARPIDGPAVDCVEELWFASREDAKAVLGPMTRHTLFGARQSFFAEEIVFFDAALGGPLR